MDRQMLKCYCSITSWFLQCVPGRRQYSGECFLPEWGLSEPPGRVRPPPPSPGYRLDPPLHSPPSAGCCSYQLPAHQPPATSVTTQHQHFLVTTDELLSMWCGVVYLLYDGNSAWSHGDHGGDGVVSLGTEFGNLLDINWTQETRMYCDVSHSTLCKHFPQLFVGK